MASLPLPLQATPQSPARSSHDSTAIVGTSAPSARLSALEWSVVALAERDRLSTIHEPNRLIAALESIFALKRPNRLANERLEALRRIAVLAWHYRWNVPKSELAAFLASGFSADQYELIQNSIGQARAGRQRRTAR